ncbi:quinoprotein dehydrogenase-associated putative ABC transporter substrate-binding protein [Beggiatoa leptomitoformis]|uniref:Quinoprotein dehydrogenase-associated putative ABC transporter substrate-binding protein n=1 Tax=Beggiatoa leptomitoformis TaxID=288004 RepID=A0A2N9YEP7_9GAMM|nr:quinoprotein dehydrogenase-associated putative ABC transporter substrate-binding protein [Beggiatoa leptomitoformis]ALG68754.1 quinoprotein dehydrogenase-associated putative ABC transporter substrate-binding protein [Beggiatoa leptomitoformis]AUI68885.1 quinoprotein dehydrogenase-associated putative ABC transporter substrate-binding protein [Beggiatoa leptomitoformis]
MFRIAQYILPLIFSTLCLTNIPSYAEETKPALPTAFRVCADPNNLPFSHQNLSGFENKIAELIAKDLKLPIEYTWFPQRMGFIQTTLRKWSDDKGRFECDIVMGVPKGFDMTANTKAYYRSTYTLVYIKGSGWDDIKTPTDLLQLPPERKQQLKIGMFAPAPSVTWILKNGLMNQAVSYQIMNGDPNYYAGQVIEQDLVNKKLNMVFIWGPVAGYFANKLKGQQELVLLPLTSEADIQFDFAMAMGVRRGEPEWKNMIEQAIERNQPAINAILTDYHIPLVEPITSAENSK